MKEVLYIISTRWAKTVRSHEAEKGSATRRRDIFRPSWSIIPPTRHPKMAPNRDKLATHDPSYLINMSRNI
jgi:hypothetical protein